MSPILTRYVMRLYVGSVALVAASVLLVFLVIDFGDRLKLYVGHSFAEVAELYVCKLAVTLGQLMPAAMLLGAGIALTTLKRRGELDAMRSIGISPAALVAPMAACAVLLAGGLVAFDELVAGPAGARVDRLMLERFGIWGDYRYYYGTQAWLRHGPSIFRVSRVAGKVLEGVTVFRLGEGFALAERVDAESMQPRAGGGFELENARIRDYAHEPHLVVQEREATRFTQTDADAFAIRPGRPEQMSTAELFEQERLRAAAGLPTIRLRLARHGRYSYPLLGAVGALLAAGLALRRNRNAVLTVALVEGLAVSAAMWGVLVVGRALALSERLPPVAAAWGPVIALGLAGLVLLRRVERAS